MENKHGSGAKAGSLEGKGFYIVLFLCAAVIGLSAWLLFTGAGTNVEDKNETAEEQVVDVSGAYVTMLPADSARQQPAAEEPAEQGQTASQEDQSGTEQTQEQTSAEEQTNAAEPSDGTETLQEQAEEDQSVFSDSAVSYIWPVQGEVQRAYCIETLAYDDTMADWRTHDGIDIACQQGTQIMSVAPGLVVDVHNDDLLGTVVEVDHENGVHSVYANLASQPPVAAGDRVNMGQVIGSVSNTALGEINQVSHLHFAMKQDGASADPTEYLASAWTE